MGINFTEGGPKKKVSEKMHEQGQRQEERYSKQANAMFEKLEAARTESKAPKTPDMPQAANTSAKPAEQRGEQTSARNTRGEANENVKQHRDEAASNFTQAQKNSRALSELLGKTAESKLPEKTATREAVAGKDPGAGPMQTAKNPPQQAQADQVQISVATSGKQPAANDKRRATNDERRTTNDERRTTNDERRATSDEKQATSAKQPVDAKIPVVAAGSKGADADDGSRFTVHEKKADAKKKGEKSGQKAGGVYAGKSGASRELSALLDGFGPGGGDTSDGAGTGAGNEIAGVLPEKDPSFHVYNDDGKNPVADVKSRALVFENRVIKNKLKQIAKLEREVDGKIRDIFETQSLRTRIVGEMDDELRKELNTARFLYGTVYGGLIG